MIECLRGAAVRDYRRASQLGRPVVFALLLGSNPQRTPSTGDGDTRSNHYRSRSAAEDLCRVALRNRPAFPNGVAGDLNGDGLDFRSVQASRRRLLCMEPNEIIRP